MELKEIYNNVAQKFANTRKKSWPELNILLDTIKGYIQISGKTKITILDVGCGSGRLYDFFSENLPLKFDYIGVDISENLLEIAKKNSLGKKNATWILHDMTSFDLGQQSVDVVVGLASFHHLDNEAQRILALKNFYKILDYQGILFLTNWNLWQNHKKYYRLVIKSSIKSVLTLGVKKWNDVYVPWNQNGTIYHRYYHMFGKKELEKLLVSSGFVIESNYFVDRYGQESSKRLESTNLITIARKDIW